MLDAKTIYGTLMLGLVGCASASGGDAAQPTTSASAVESAAVTTPTPELTSSDAPVSSVIAPATSSSAMAGNEVKKPLPGGRTEPLPPMDKKMRSGKDSVRKGEASCCGEGTCGPCAPLPGNATAPKPPKAGPVQPASQSKRTGAKECCGEGTCGPC